MFKRIARKGLEIASPLLYGRHLRKSGHDWNGKMAAVTLSFDVDWPQDVQALPRLTELLDSYQLKATFACIGKWIEKYPREHQRIVEAGHELMNHTYSHPNSEFLNPEKFCDLSPHQQENEIAFFDEVAQHVLDTRAAGFRAPHFGDLNSQVAYDVLEKRGYVYSSSTALTSTVSTGTPYRPSREDFRKADEKNGYALLELPVFTCPEHYFSVFDTWHVYHTGAHNGGFSRLFQKSLNLGVRFGSYVNTYFDPRDVAQNREFEQALQVLKERKDVWTATSRNVAETWLKPGGRRQ